MKSVSGDRSPSPHDDLLTETAMQQIPPAPNAAPSPWPLDKAVHHYFEDQAAATPDAVAVLFEDEVLSYAQVNARANRLAHQLIRLGVRRGNLVGLCMERCADVIVGLLGILK